MALPGHVRPPDRRRDGRRVARWGPHRRVARGHGRPRQGRLARRARRLAAASRGGVAPAPRLAVDPGRAGGEARLAQSERLRRRPAPRRLPEGVHGRDARVADRADAGRLRAWRSRAASSSRSSSAAAPKPGCHWPSTPSATSRIARPSTRSRRRASCGSRSAPPPDRACPGAGLGGCPPLRRARSRCVGAVQPCAVRPRPRRAVLGRQDRGRLRVPLAEGFRRAGRERLRRTDRGADSLGRDRRGRVP